MEVEQLVGPLPIDREYTTLDEACVRVATNEDLAPVERTLLVQSPIEVRHLSVQRIRHNTKHSGGFAAQGGMCSTPRLKIGSQHKQAARGTVSLKEDASHKAVPEQK